MSLQILREFDLLATLHVHKTTDARTFFYLKKTTKHVILNISGTNTLLQGTVLKLNQFKHTSVRESKRVHVYGN